MYLLQKKDANSNWKNVENHEYVDEKQKEVKQTSAGARDIAPVSVAGAVHLADGRRRPRIAVIARERVRHADRRRHSGRSDRIRRSGRREQGGGVGCESLRLRAISSDLCRRESESDRRERESA